MKRGLTYDDILLVPKYSEVKSRSIINTNTLVSRRYGLLKPLVASCMDTVCEYKMSIKMVELGGVGCIHRFMTIDEQCEQVSKVVEYINNNHMYEHWGVMYDNWHSEIKQIPVMAAIGVNDVDIDRAIRLVLSGVNIILIDVAHGHHINVKNMIRKLREVLPTSVDIIAGNISTKESAEDLCEWGADGLRVGIGGGSLCTTRIQTGHGVPNVTSIIDCVEGSSVPVMADGGIRNSGVNIILIDVAHGHHINVKNMIRKLREVLPTSVDIIAGNISTKESAEDLCEWGADGLRVGIGGGSLCTTRIQTGHGVPNVTSIIDCVEGSSVPVMADGGIRNSGDISKALSVGADCVMLGSLLAGTKESPGKIVEKGNGSLYKRYRGSASLETKSAHKQSTKHIEGESTMIPFKGSVEYIIDNLNDGLKSALSYSGSKDIKDFHLKSEVMEITPSGMAESKPHLL